MVNQCIEMPQKLIGTEMDFVVLRTDVFATLRAYGASLSSLSSKVAQNV